MPSTSTPQSSGDADGLPFLMASATENSKLEDAPAAENSDDETTEGKPYNDLIQWPDEPPPPKEVWEVEPLYEWEKDDRGYIFEGRLEGAEAHKAAGNTHYKAGEWDMALRRYRRSIYFCAFDPMQMHDLMDHHKEQVAQIQMHCKLNLVACIVKMSTLDDGSEKLLPEGSLDHAVVAINEVLEVKKDQPKVHFRKGQVLMLQQDLAGARESLTECRKLGGDGKELRAAMKRLKELEKAERVRERSLYGGKIQAANLHQPQEAEAAKQLARRQSILTVLYYLAFPLIAPFKLLEKGWSYLPTSVSGTFDSLGEKVGRKFASLFGIDLGLEPAETSFFVGEKDKVI